jgi:hypothetical protein
VLCSPLGTCVHFPESTAHSAQYTTEAACRHTCERRLVELLHQHGDQYRLADRLDWVSGYGSRASRAACCTCVSRLAGCCAATGTWRCQQFCQANGQTLHIVVCMRKPAGQVHELPSAHNPTTCTGKQGSSERHITPVHAHLQLCIMRRLCRCSCPRVPHLRVGPPVAHAVPGARRPGCWPGPAAGTAVSIAEGRAVDEGARVRCRGRPQALALACALARGSITRWLARCEAMRTLCSRSLRACLWASAPACAPRPPPHRARCAAGSLDPQDRGWTTGGDALELSGATSAGMRLATEKIDS